MPKFIGPLLLSLLCVATGCEVSFDGQGTQQQSQPNVGPGPGPQQPYIWSPNQPLPLDRCPDGKCPTGGVFYDGAKFVEVPVANLPKELREENWGGGSCVFASTVAALRWNGMYNHATWMRQNYSGGAGVSRLANALDHGNVRYAYTDDANYEFLRWCTRTRRMATIFYYPSHSVAFAGIYNGNVYLMDNNRINSYQIIPENEFYGRWKGYGGFALAILDGAPMPPLAWTGN